MAEDDRVPWSVHVHSCEDMTDLLLVDPQDPVAHGKGALCWHLGPVDGKRLDDLAAVRRVPGCRLPGDGRAKVLVWCVGHGEAAGWASLVPLERLTGLLGPRRVEILCVPERPRVGGRAEMGPVPDAEVVRTLALRAAEVCAQPVSGHLLTGDMSVAARNAVLARMHPDPVGRPVAICAGPDADPPLA